MHEFFTMHSGETAAPVPDGPTLCPATEDMKRIHRVFLWSYSEAPGLARSAAAGDTARSGVVGEALATFDKLLHEHHSSENLFMYPKIAERAPACALHVDMMLAQHAEVTDLLTEIEPVRARWAATADPELGEDLARRYEHLYERLQIHLRREVTEMMPVVEKIMTVKEADEMAQHSISAFEKKVVFAYLGIVLAANPPDERKAFFMAMPTPIRLVYRLIGKRLYEKQYAALFPGREIPPTL